MYQRGGWRDDPAPPVVPSKAADVELLELRALNRELTRRLEAARADANAEQQRRRASEAHATELADALAEGGAAAGDATALAGSFTVGRRAQRREDHRFGGCSLCGCVPTHWVGLAIRGSGSAGEGDVSLCSRCYDEEYAPIPVLRRMFQWARVRDLIGAKDPVAERRLADRAALPPRAATAPLPEV